MNRIVSSFASLIVSVLVVPMLVLINLPQKIVGKVSSTSMQKEMLEASDNCRGCDACIIGTQE